MSTSKAEQETIYRYDQEERRVHFWTAYEPDANMWRRKGYAVEVYGGGWRTSGPMGCISVRTLVNGELVKPKGNQSPNMVGLARKPDAGIEPDDSGGER